MSEDTSEGFADQSRPMVSCRGCGFVVEIEDVRSGFEVDHSERKRVCDMCRKCELCPDMRESYRRGFNAGLDAMRDRAETAARLMKRHELAPSNGAEDRRR